MGLHDAPPCLANFCISVEMGFHHVDQASLELLTSSDPPWPLKVLQLQCIRCHVALQECSASVGCLVCWLLVGSKKCTAEKEKEEARTLDGREQHVLG
ncbi:Protein GVQW1 [Plecturocebus cupreus]